MVQQDALKDFSNTTLDNISMEYRKGPYGEQFNRYLNGLPNWVLTDYFEFRWFVNGKKRLTARIAELDAKGKIRPTKDGEQKLDQLFNAFFKEPALTVASAKDLAASMARMTRIVRDQIIESFKQEAEETERRRVREEVNGYGVSPSARGPWLHNWLSAFRETLIPDLKEGQFADMFAQTLAYGLFAARVHAPTSETFSRKMAAYNLPKTNPFLRKLFAEIAGVDMPDSIAWAVDDIVELLKHADMSEILKDFGKGKGKEDPVVHFYETFLAAYDPKMRELRGVYYTPEPVVSYIVRSIDYLLKTRFNRPKGLADENTLILDPATGTATFLYFVIDHIHQTFAKQKGAWDDYVAQHLLNRIFGFELLMAPYAVAHLKLGMQLEQTGYRFGSDQRLGIYLTNTLDEAAKKSDQLFTSWVAEEANAAAKIKRDEPILVVLGNPPYSGHSANRSRDENGNFTFIGKLIEDYKFVDDQPLGERNPKWLQNDYVKFIRFGQWRIDKTCEGVIGFITSNSYLDSPTFRGMRQNLLRSFSEICILDLHGNAKKKERTPNGGEDKNVFDITEGVAILLCIKQKDNAKSVGVVHSDLWGTRDRKYKFLAERDIATTRWKQLKPSSPFYMFVPQHVNIRSEYEQGWKITEAMPINVLGFQTHRDHFAIDFEKGELKARIAEFRDTRTNDDEIRTRFEISDNRDWKISEARARIRTDKYWESRLIECAYRPFDFRFGYYDEGAMDYPRRELIAHMLCKENLALNITRQTKATTWQHAIVSNKPAPAVFVELKDGSNLFPLYLYPAAGRELNFHADRRPNFSTAFLRILAEKLKQSQEEQYGLPKDITPEDIFHYIYAVFHSPTYRTRYADFLKIDFPRVPLTSNLKLFRALSDKGAELVALHLLESPKVQDFITGFPMKGDNIVEKVQYTDKDKRVWINKTQHFSVVPKEVWEFYIGGYQVCEKWLKDRKGRKLSYDDIQHYQKIVIALNETIRLMAEIDRLIPGWPMT
jgi:predicted helicase